MAISSISTRHKVSCLFNHFPNFSFAQAEPQGSDYKDPGV